MSTNSLLDYLDGVLGTHTLAYDLETPLKDFFRSQPRRTRNSHKESRRSRTRLFGPSFRRRRT
jgi:hypothetical protein